MNGLDPEKMAFYMDTYIVPWGIKIIMALAIFVIGKWIARYIVKIVKKLMTKARLDDVLVKFLGSILYTLLLVAVIIAAVDQLGVNTTSLLAIFGAAGLAVGLALQGSLSNFAAGVMLILFRPFKTGDFIEAAGIAGVVEQITVFTTNMRTGDNRSIIVPNSKIFGDTITNVSAKDTRRIDLVIGIGYDDDIRKAKELIEGVMSADDRILKEPAAAIAVGELADSSVNLNVRPWVNTGDYWPVRSDMLENIKKAFDENGVSIPYPQQDVHMHEVKSA
jgi:small conductance mechanosensitive channel